MTLVTKVLRYLPIFLLFEFFPFFSLSLFVSFWCILAFLRSIFLSFCLLVELSSYFTFPALCKFHLPHPELFLHFLNLFLYCLRFYYTTMGNNVNNYFQFCCFFATEYFRIHIAPIQRTFWKVLAIVFPRAKFFAGADQPAAFRMSPFVNLPMSRKHTNE